MTETPNYTTATVEDLLDNPTKYGAPTFEEFKRYPDRYRKRDDDALSSADVGSSNLAHLVKKQFYFLKTASGRSIKCKTLEQVEHVAKQEGINLRLLEMRPELRQAGEGKFDVHVHFVTKRIASLGDYA